MPKRLKISNKQNKDTRTRKEKDKAERSTMAPKYDLIKSCTV